MTRKPVPLAQRQEEPAAKLAAALERLTRLVLACTWQASGPRQLSPLQLAILERLGEKSQGVRELAAHLQVAKATVSRALQVLGKKGLVNIDPDPADRRLVVAHLTAPGRLALRETQAWATPLLRALTSLPERQQGQLLLALLQLLRQFEQEGLMAKSHMCLSCRFLQGEGEGFYCQLLQTPLSLGQLRVHCPDWQPVP